MDLGGERRWEGKDLEEWREGKQLLEVIYERIKKKKIALIMVSLPSNTLPN